MNRWNLPASPELPTSLVDLLQGAINRRTQQQMEVIEQVAYYAYRDGHGLFMERDSQGLVDVRVSKYVPAGTMYIADLSVLDEKLRLPTLGER